MFEAIRSLKRLTGKKTLIGAIVAVWKRGLTDVQAKEAISELQAKNEKYQNEHLEMSRLVHEYETKLVNLERRFVEAERQKKEFEWGYRGLYRENQWMKEELMNKNGRRER